MSHSEGKFDEQSPLERERKVDQVDFNKAAVDVIDALNEINDNIPETEKILADSYYHLEDLLQRLRGVRAIRGVDEAYLYAYLPAARYLHIKKPAVYFDIDPENEDRIVLRKPEEKKNKKDQLVSSSL